MERLCSITAAVQKLNLYISSQIAIVVARRLIVINTCILRSCRSRGGLRPLHLLLLCVLSSSQLQPARGCCMGLNNYLYYFGGSLLSLIVTIV